MRRSVLLAFVLYAAFCYAECATGTVEGKVSDDKGQPVSGAEVLSVSNNCTVIGKPPIAITNKDGGFHLADVPEGTNRVYARKENERYPDTRYAIFEDPAIRVPIVEVPANGTVTGVGVTVRKYGVLSGRIVDAETSQPVLSARLNLERPDDPSIMLSTSPGFDGEFRLLLPPRAIHFFVTAEDFETWQYSGPRQLAPGIVELQSDDKPRITIRIKKATIPNRSPSN